MNCPRCKNDSLTSDDDQCWSHVANFFWKYANPIKPVSSLLNLGKGMINVGRTIYYDFSSISQTDEYLWCTICDHYFIPCPHCGHLNDIGTDIMVSPKKIKCKGCGKDYVYATHPSEDHEIYV